jgi:actin-related protein 8
MVSGDNATPTPPTLPEGGAAQPTGFVDVECLPSTPGQASTPKATPNKGASSTVAANPGGFVIDVCFEASKLPLDVAIFNSARAAGGDEKIRKYLQAVLVIGGTALIPGMAHALESRFVDTLLSCFLFLRGN